MAKDLVDLLAEEHRALQQLLQEAREATRDQQRDVLGDLARAVGAHLAAEREVLQEARDRLGGAVPAGVWERQAFKEADAPALLAEVRAAAAGEGADPDAVEDLRDLVLAHVEEDEAYLFPGLREGLLEAESEELGRAFEERKRLHLQAREAERGAAAR